MTPEGKRALSSRIAQAEAGLQRLDPVLGKLIAAQARLIRLREGTYFGNLVRSIASQQISVAASQAILGRLLDAKPG